MLFYNVVLLISRHVIDVLGACVLRQTSAAAILAYTSLNRLTIVVELWTKLNHSLI